MPAEELLLFLLAILHQDYNTALEMPVDVSIRLAQGFGVWIEKMFSGTTATSSDLSHAFVPNLTIPKEWAEKLAKDKAAVELQRQKRLQQEPTDHY